MLIITHVFQILDDGVKELLVVDEPVGDGGHGRLIVIGATVGATAARPRVGGGGRLQLGQSCRDGRANSIGQVGFVLKYLLTLDRTLLLELQSAAIAWS